jgi:hypothetical protein
MEEDQRKDIVKRIHEQLKSMNETVPSSAMEHNRNAPIKSLLSEVASLLETPAETRKRELPRG